MEKLSDLLLSINFELTDLNTIGNCIQIGFVITAIVLGFVVSRFLIHYMARRTQQKVLTNLRKFTLRSFEPPVTARYHAYFHPDWQGGLGFGLQRIASDFTSGFLLPFDKFIKPGDVISIGNKFGWEEELHARYIVVHDRDIYVKQMPNVE